MTVVALYEENQILPLPQMYGKNLTFKTGGVDGCHCDEILKLIEDGKIDTTPLITHTFELKDIEKAYDIFENRKRKCDKNCSEMLEKAGFCPAFRISKIMINCRILL